jgi:hypothetical protein
MLGRHMTTCFSYISPKKKQKVLSINGKKFDGVGTVTNFCYDEREEKAREFCSHMIFYNEYSFILAHRFA